MPVSMQPNHGPPNADRLRHGILTYPETGMLFVFDSAQWRQYSEVVTCRFPDDRSSTLSRPGRSPGQRP